jgi:glycine oxidase
MVDVLIIGGGVIGLSLAWELARRGSRVQLIERGEPGQEASWAGAGILPSASRASSDPYERLCVLACDLHPRWAAQLRELTGIETGYRRCGGWYLGRTYGERAALAAWANLARDDGMPIERVPIEEMISREPGLNLGHGHGRKIQDVYLDPDESQLRNPRHVQALLAACRSAEVDVVPQTDARELVVKNGQIAELQTTRGAMRAGRYCFTAGAWTGKLLAAFGTAVNVLPIRGQMVLFQCKEPPVSRIVNEGSRYLVPRDDGRLLAGSTEEEVGFDKRTTEEGIAELTAFARQLVPALADAQIERTWAGLRPASLDGLPYMGRLPGLENAFVAAGHFRSGLYLSPAVAVVMSQLLDDEPPQIDLTPLGVLR